MAYENKVFQVTS